MRSVPRPSCGFFIPRAEWDVKAPFAHGRKEEQYGEVGSGTAARLAEGFGRLLRR